MNFSRPPFSVFKEHLCCYPVNLLFISQLLVEEHDKCDSLAQPLVDFVNAWHWHELLLIVHHELPTLVETRAIHIASHLGILGAFEITCCVWSSQNSEQQMIWLLPLDWSIVMIIIRHAMWLLISTMPLNGSHYLFCPLEESNLGEYGNRYCTSFSGNFK